MKKQNGTIIVTGASRGIGSAIVRDIAHRGYHVACLSRKGIGVEDTAIPDQIASQLSHYICDVTDEKSIVDAFTAVDKGPGNIIGLINNAGIYTPGRSENYSSDKLRNIFQTNTESVFIACREIYPYLKKNGAGTIINIGSFYDRVAAAYNTAYCASKAAVASISRCLAVEWAKDGIRVLNIGPGYIATDLNKKERETEVFMDYLRTSIPVGRAGEPSEVAKLVGSLIEDDIQFLTGETIYIDGGQGTKLA